MPTLNKLTDTKCRAIKPGAKLTKTFDGGGLMLCCTPLGAKVWRVAYRLAGKPQTISLGPYPEVSLAEARTKRDALKATLRDGGDPMAPRKARRGGLTVQEVCTAYWQGRGDASEGYRRNAERAMEMHVYPFIGHKPMASIGRDDLMAVLDRMNAAKLFVYVRRVRMWLGLAFEQAVARGDAKINPAALINPAKAFGRAKVEHFASLAPAEMPEFLQRLALEAELQSVLACRLLALTWVRTAELRMMQWTEVEGDVWRIPAGKMKRRIEHVVPLAPQALAILKTLKSRSRGGVYVFPSEHRIDRPMSENAVLYLLHRMGYKGRLTGHGFRSVASTWANEAGYRADAIERQLAHVPGDKTRAAYNRAEFLPERRAMLMAWADWLEQQGRG